MQLERVLIVVERRSKSDGSFAAWDLDNMEGSLKHTGMVDNIDVIYYGDYTPNCDEAVVNYCIKEKPQVVLLSLQSMISRGGGLTFNAAGKITHLLKIPTVAFWFSIYADPIADLLVRYLRAVSLNVILGADASSHKPMPLEGTNYVYAMLQPNEGQFNIPDGQRDIPVGLIASLVPFRRTWIDGLAESGISVFTAGGQMVEGGDTSFSTGKAPPLWLPYKEYIRLTSRLKIALNFSSGMGPLHSSVATSTGQAERVLSRLTAHVKRGLPEFIKHPGRWKDAIPAIKRITAASVKKPGEMIRFRVTEALWCRTFLLEEYNPITERYFEPNVDYVPFYTLKDLAEKIEYYLENDEERDKIRLQGRATVEKYYNTGIYWENMFEITGIIPGGQDRHHPGEIWNKAHFDNWFLSVIDKQGVEE